MEKEQLQRELDIYKDINNFLLKYEKEDNYFINNDIIGNLNKKINFVSEQLNEINEEEKYINVILPKIISNLSLSEKSMYECNCHQYREDRYKHYHTKLYVLKNYDNIILVNNVYVNYEKLAIINSGINYISHDCECGGRNSVKMYICKECGCIICCRTYCSGNSFNSKFLTCNLKIVEEYLKRSD
jgi:hypothetical protein